MKVCSVLKGSFSLYIGPGLRKRFRPSSHHPYTSRDIKIIYVCTSSEPCKPVTTGVNKLCMHALSTAYRAQGALLGALGASAPSASHSRGLREAPRMLRVVPECCAALPYLVMSQPRVWSALLGSFEALRRIAARGPGFRSRACCLVFTRHFCPRRWPGSVSHPSTERQAAAHRQLHLRRHQLDEQL